MADSSESWTRILVASGSLVLLALLVIANIVFFDEVLGFSYPTMWLEQGSMFALSIALIALVWTELDTQHPDLISAHPGHYLITCFVILSGIFMAVANSIPRRGFISASRAPTSTVVRMVYDTFVALALYVVIALLAMVWLLAVAPAMYFTVLISGAPARLARLVSAPEFTLARSSPGPNGSTNREFFTLTFARKPVTVTAALTAVVLWLTRVIVL